MAPDVGDAPEGHRVAHYPAEEEWPDLEEEHYEGSDFPMGGPFAVAYEFLHGARITLDQGLTRPTRLLVAAAARNALRIAAERDEAADASEEAALDALGRGEVEADAEDLLDSLTTLAVFIEKRIVDREE